MSFIFLPSNSDKEEEIEIDGVGIKNELLAYFEEDVTACMWLLGNIAEAVADTKEEHRNHSRNLTANT